MKGRELSKYKQVLEVVVNLFCLFVSLSCRTKTKMLQKIYAYMYIRTY